MKCWTVNCQTSTLPDSTLRIFMIFTCGNTTRCTMWLTLLEKYCWENNAFAQSIDFRLRMLRKMCFFSLKVEIFYRISTKIQIFQFFTLKFYENSVMLRHRM